MSAGWGVKGGKGRAERLYKYVGVQNPYEVSGGPTCMKFNAVRISSYEQLRVYFHAGTNYFFGSITLPTLKIKAAMYKSKPILKNK